MILFKEDWKRYPTAIVDDTLGKNESFLKYSMLLRDMGVKNHLWPLALINPELKGIDPFDSERPLTDRQKDLFRVEFKINPWAFFRLVARVGEPSGDFIDYFLANRSNMGMFWLYYNAVDLFWVQIRQTGKTMGMKILDNYHLNVRCNGANILLLTASEKLRSETLKDIKRLEELLPPFLRVKTKKDISNLEKISISALNNHYNSLIAANDRVAAEKAGRGLTIDNLRIDEVAYLYFLKKHFGSIGPVTDKGRQKAALRDDPYGTIMVTTAGNLSNDDGKYAYELYNNSAMFTEHLFDIKNKKELYSIIKSNSSNGKILRVRGCFNHRQLGLTDEWLQETIQRNDSTGSDREKDYFNKWIFSDKDSPLSPEEIKTLSNAISEIKYMSISEHGLITMRWYIKEHLIKNFMHTHHTLCQVDTSQALGNDDFGIIITDINTGAVISASNINRMSISKIATMLGDLLITYPKMTLLIERKDQAVSILDIICDMLIEKRINPFKRIYNQIAQYHVQHRELYDRITQDSIISDEYFIGDNKKYFGFITAGSGKNKRELLYGTALKTGLKYGAALTRDETLINQLLSLINKNNRITHPANGHDDMVIAWLLGYWFMEHGRNLSFYGIPHGYVLSENEVLYNASSENKVIDAYEIIKKKKIKERIKVLLEEAKIKKDPFVLNKIRYELLSLKSQIDDSSVIVSIDEFINSHKTNNSTVYEKRSLFGR